MWERLQPRIFQILQFCGSYSFSYLQLAMMVPEGQQIHIYHSADLRKGRYVHSGNYYLLTTVTNKRQPILADFGAARICINAMRRQHELGRIFSQAFVVMPDHFHWLLELRCNNLSGVIRAVKGRAARLINTHLDRHGPIWQKGYRDHALRRDEDLRVTARYLAANPLRVGLVKTLYDYPHWDAVWL